MGFHLITNKYQILTVVSSSMLDLCRFNDWETSSTELKLVLACKRVLLEAKADPTLPFSIEDGAESETHMNRFLDTSSLVGLFFRCS